MAFQKEHLVIFFNPLQLEIHNTIIKLQLLWLPTFVPAAVSEALALHNPPTPHPFILGDSVLLLHPQYHACKRALLSSLCKSSRPRVFNWNLYLFFIIQHCTLSSRVLPAVLEEVYRSCTNVKVTLNHTVILHYKLVLHPKPYLIKTIKVCHLIFNSALYFKIIVFVAWQHFICWEIEPRFQLCGNAFFS